MKRSLLLLVLSALLAGLLWSNKRGFAFLLHDRFAQRRPVVLAEIRKPGIDVFYARSGYVAKNIDRLVQTFRQNLRDAAQQTGVQLPSRVTLYLYNNWEEKGSHIKDIRIAHVDPQSDSIHCIVNDQYNGLSERPEYRVLVNTRLGYARHADWNTYAAVALAGIWNRHSLENWAAFFRSRDLVPIFPSFLTAGDGISEFLRVPWNALFARFVLKTYGWNSFELLFKSGAPPPGFQNRWDKYVLSIPIRRHQRYVFEPQFQKGMSYAYANSYHGGYATLASHQSLGLLKANDVEWIAAIPYGFMRSHDATQIRFSGHNITGESDESMAAVADDARKLGLRVMMKPQLWISHDAWPGKINFASAAEWDRWLTSYENWIIHYAILSELINADLFCIGTELVHATLGHPDRWERMIARIRKIYRGPLVYAANHGREFEQIAFWPSLDYLGLDNYYAVRKSPDDGISEMKIAFAKQKEKLRGYALRYRKQLLFTEIGYMANEGAGTGPAEYNYSLYDERAQATCFRLALETYYSEPWFAGMYWWKWFSDPNDRGKQADAHSPHGRPAEVILREWYEKTVPSPQFSVQR